MAYTTTKSIFQRVEAALEFDLLGYTDADSPVDSDANGGLSPLNTEPVIERVERYMIDVVGAGDLYATVRGTGIAVGYSFMSDLPDGPENLQGGSIGRQMPIEVTVLAVVGSMKEMIGSERGEQIDDVMDDVKRIFGSGRRDGTNFNAQTVTLHNVQKLDGGSREAPWIGRTLPIHVRRDERDLLT